MSGLECKSEVASSRAGFLLLMLLAGMTQKAVGDDKPPIKPTREFEIRNDRAVPGRKAGSALGAALRQRSA